MSVKTVRPARNLGSAQTEFGWSPGIWHDCRWDQIKEGEVPGVVFEDLFTTMPKTPATTEGNFGQYTQFSDTGGFINSFTSAVGGGWSLGSDGDNEGASIRSRAAPFKIIRTAKQFWFEAIFRTSTVADTKHGFFLGLTEDTAFSATVPIAAAGTLADINFVGFHRLEGDGDQLDTVYKADGVTQVSVQTDVVSGGLSADTDYKVGMVFKPSEDPFVHAPNPTDATVSAKFNLFFYLNGIRLTTAKVIPSAAGTDFPNDVNLGLAFAVLNATASTPGNTVIRRWRAAQEF